MNTARYYLIQDPHHDYAVRFMEHIYRRYGYQAVCIYTDRRERLRQRSQFPQLSSQCVAASFDVRADQWQALADYVGSRYQIVAVVPHNEPTVLAAVELATRLGLHWVQPEVMRRFRDKFALKDYLRREHPEIRMNATQRVRSAADVQRLRGEHYARFVLKPNDGFGNRQIGLFGPDSCFADIEAYFQQLENRPVVMEQYIGGTEYFVNGQVDAKGRVTVVAVFEYCRQAANGRHNIDFETRRVAYASPVFGQLARYAQRVVCGTGLRRSPFHLEAKVDDQGPCLIEVAARLVGHGNAILCGELHGKRLNLIDLACHYYFETADAGPLALNWEQYDSAAVRYVHGVATRHERIYALHGVQQVESLPEFHGWVTKPRVGMKVQPTRDLLSMPWSLVLKAPTESKLTAAATIVREALRWDSALPRAPMMALAARIQATRYARALRLAVLARVAGLRPMVP